MIFAELALYLTTPVDRTTRSLGLLWESITLWSRGVRHRRLWAEHHANCQAVVTGAMAGLKQRRKVLVLGSGLVRDVPLDRLCEAFEEVVLVDAVHLPLVRLRMVRRPKVRLVTRDLTGIMPWLAGKVEGRSDPVADFVADEAIDLVISANLLSQLAWPVEDWLEKEAARAPRFPADLPRRCVAWHLEDLRRFKGRVCLLSDVEMIERDRSGAITDRLDLTRGEALPAPDESWDWVVAPFGEAARDRDYVHRVCAWRNVFPSPLAGEGGRAAVG
ncbi:hypothetical protein DWF00_05245 [Bosea caraganae]|uniref:Class I SAM-dependent methyltransferase n=1 Tax=Bosea caraganae TaxID=2763117 RepID=A0A370L088_9HYPH|nr:hypothetical protein [Bosea caraganae]RDJ20680.1 hypothetical protein DWE98_23350 [Bosea caraganae]RDJ28957.1 hypothetical protein DWF00_05245 [Bosea caraganae]